MDWHGRITSKPGFTFSPSRLLNEFLRYPPLKIQINTIQILSLVPLHPFLKKGLRRSLLIPGKGSTNRSEQIIIRLKIENSFIAKVFLLPFFLLFCERIPKFPCRVLTISVPDPVSVKSRVSVQFLYCFCTVSVSKYTDTTQKQQ